MKLQTLEQFESKDPCECGGNCGCGSKPVNEKFSFSKKEVEAAASLIASAISKTDKVKAEVHDLEYDKGRGAGFEISIDGEKYDGGSYVVKDNGDVVNAAIGNSHPNAVYNTIGNKDIADVFTNMKKYESTVTESKGYKAGDEVELKTGETVKINQVVKGPRAELNTYRAKVKGKQIDFSLSDINESIVTEKIKITKDDWPIIKFKDGGKKYEVEFDDYDVIDDHGNEGKDVYFMGTDQDGKEWTIDASVGYNYENSGNIDDIHYDTLARMDESKINEAKKYKFKEVAKAWEFVYGEDMEDEYEGFYQEVVGKYKNKVTKSDIAEIWSNVYGEDVAAEYGGFYDSLKENVNEAIKLEAFNNIEEANSDGTISDDEDELMDDLLGTVEATIDDLIADAREKAYEIGGGFRGPGNVDRIKKLLVAKVKKIKL